MSRFAEQYCECSVCGTDVLAEGNWHGDGWNEPREFEPFDDPLLCDRCESGTVYTLKFTVIGHEDFSKMKWPRHWHDWFEGFDSVYVQTVEVKKHD